MGKDMVKIRSENQIVELAHNYLEEIKSTRITSRDAYQRVFVLVRQSKLFQDSVKQYFEDIRAPAYEALQAVYAKINSALKPFQEGEKIGKANMADWERIEADRAREAERKLQDKREEAIKAAKANGDQERVAELRAAPIPVVENKAHQEGVQFVDNWKGRLVSKPAFIQAVLDGKAPEEWLLLNEQAVNKFARDTRGVVAVPGLEWYNERIVKVATK